MGAITTLVLKDSSDVDVNYSPNSSVSGNSQWVDPLSLADGYPDMAIQKFRSGFDNGRKTTSSVHRVNLPVVDEDGNVDTIRIIQEVIIPNGMSTANRDKAAYCNKALAASSVVMDSIQKLEPAY